MSGIWNTISGAGPAQETAQAQLSSQSVLNEQASKLTAPTTYELEIQDKNFASAQAAINRGQTLLSAVDPTLMEAGRQALALLQGQDAPTLAPLERILNTQQGNLMQSLQSQLGPGALAGSAGQSALTNFQMNAANTLSQQQQNYLGTLLGSTQNTESQASQEALGGIGGLQGLYGNIQNQQGMQANALIGTSTTPYAGAPYAGSAASSEAAGGIVGPFIGQLLGTRAAGGQGATGSGTTYGGQTSGGQTMGSLQNSAPAGATDSPSSSGIGGAISAIAAIA